MEEKRDVRWERQLALGRMVNRIQAFAPLYRTLRLGWRALTSLAGRLGLRKLVWRWRLPTEVAHWDLWLRTRGANDPAEFERRLSPDLPLQGYLGALLPESNGRAYRILDIGAGPLSSVGKMFQGRKVDLVPIDPLATVYNALLEANGISPPVRTEHGEGEQIAQIYPENSFDLVHAQNSLDHVHDPLKAITGALRVVRPGGFVYLAHTVNEGAREGYGGLHQWNFALEGGSFTITSKTGQKTNVSRELANAARMNPSIHEGMLIVRIQKIQPGAVSGRRYPPQGSAGSREIHSQ